jgi:hypothetical protein
MMNKLLGILTPVIFALLSFLNTQAYAQSWQSGGQDQGYGSSSGGIAEYFEGLRPDSLRILKEAISKTNKDIYNQMYDALSRARIEEGSDCDSETEAYVDGGDNTIYVCQTSSVGYNIRTLLHESVHLIGIHDECDADYYSGLAEIDSGEGLTGGGGYDNECPHPLSN